MKKITLLMALFAVMTFNAQVTIWEDSFETYEDFAVENIGDYTMIDLDGSGTYGSAQYDFLNESYGGVSILFNPSLAIPDPTGTETENADQNPNWVARTGDKGMYFFAATSLLNDDYLITPAISLAGASGSSFSFWAHSKTDEFGLEQFEVLLSTTGTDTGDFTENLSGGIEMAPIGDYVEFSYDISAYDGMDVYIAIHYVAADSFILMTDDYKVEAATLSVEDNSFEGFTYFVNANNQLNLSATTPMDGLAVYNMLGQEVASHKLANTNEVVNISDLPSGIYLAQVSIEGNTKSIKIVKR